MTTILDKVRAKQIDAGHAVNEPLAEFVQSTSFSMSLGRTHITALAHIAANDQMWTEGTYEVIPSAMRGLERRGLVEHDDAQRRWRLTTAGKLMVMLLIEAGLLPASVGFTELPPPPPGWTDPRKPLLDPL